MYTLYCSFNVLGTPTTPKPCLDTIPNCKDYPDTTCTNPDYDLWVEDNCRKHCGRCMFRSYSILSDRYACLWSFTRPYLKGDTLSCGTQYLGFLDGTQNAKGWYAVRRNSVTSIFTLKRSSCHQETHHTWQTKSNNSKKFAPSLRSRFLGISAFINFNIELSFLHIHDTKIRKHSYMYKLFT